MSYMRMGVEKMDIFSFGFCTKIKETYDDYLQDSNRLNVVKTVFTYPTLMQKAGKASVRVMGNRFHFDLKRIL